MSDLIGFSGNLEKLKNKSLVGEIYLPSRKIKKYLKCRIYKELCLKK